MTVLDAAGDAHRVAVQLVTDDLQVPPYGLGANGAWVVEPALTKPVS